MTKHKIRVDEWYPVFSLGGYGYDREIELTKEEEALIRKASEAFDRAQGLISGKLDKLERPKEPTPGEKITRMSGEAPKE